MRFFLPRFAASFFAPCRFTKRLRYTPGLRLLRMWYSAENLRDTAKAAEKVLVATSRWCAVDFATGKLLTPKAFPEQDYKNAEIYSAVLSGAPQGKTTKISPEDGEKKFEIKIANSEYDHNLHVNNTRYADYCLNCFSVAELTRKSVRSFSISYVKQCKEGETLAFYRKDEESRSLICGYNERGENVVRTEFSFVPRKFARVKAI